MASAAADTSNTTMHAATIGTHRASVGTPIGLSGPGLELNPAKGPGKNAEARATSTIPDTAARTPHRPARPSGRPSGNSNAISGSSGGPSANSKASTQAAQFAAGAAALLSDQRLAAPATAVAAAEASSNQPIGLPGSRATNATPTVAGTSKTTALTAACHHGSPAASACPPHAADPTPATKSHSEPARTAYRRPAAPVAPGTSGSLAAMSITH